MLALYQCTTVQNKKVLARDQPVQLIARDSVRIPSLTVLCQNIRK